MGPSHKVSLSTRIEPRKWQREALSVWCEQGRGVAKVVTGGGKTVFAYLCIEAFLNDHDGDAQVIIVVPTISLLDQWYLDILDSLQLEADDVGCYSGEGQPERPALINILVLNSARRAAPNLCESSDLPSLLIVDECHRAGSPENAKALGGRYSATLGLSATPERELDDGFEDRIVPALGPVIYEYDYAAAHRDEVIVDFDLINVEVATGADRVVSETSLGRDIDRMLTSECGSKPSRKKLVERAARAADNAARVPWAAKLALLHRNERVVIFHERVASLQLIVDLLRAHGQNSISYHSHLSDAHRRDNLSLFRRGVVNILVTCRALDEGTNVPEANVAIVARSTSSTRQRIQRLGRVLRPARGKEVATIYTLYTGEAERDLLSDEAVGLEGVASISWKKGGTK